MIQVIKDLFFMLIFTFLYFFSIMMGGIFFLLWILKNKLKQNGKSRS
jgi:hypothetical protein